MGEGAADGNLGILDTISVTASNGATIDFNNGNNATTEGDINTQGDLVSMIVSADGTGSTVEAPGLHADGDNIGQCGIQHPMAVRSILTALKL